MIDRFVDQVDTTHEIGVIVVASDKVGQTLRRVGSQVIDVLELVLGEQPLDQLVIGDIALDELGSGRHLIPKAAAQIVEYNHLLAQGKTMSSDV
jgi:hypothetical protein